MAEFITWSNDWLLGIDALDDQHKALAECLNSLAAECEQARDAPESMGKRKETLAALLDALYTLTKKHFGFEEALMRDTDYPSYTEHAREHVMLIAELKATFINALKEDRCNLDPENLKALKSWLIAHVARSDREFANFLLEMH